MRRLLSGAALACALLLFAPALRAAEIHVVSSGGFAAALKLLAPEFERQTGNKLVLAWGPSMGDTHDAVPQRIARGENDRRGHHGRLRARQAGRAGQPSPSDDRVVIARSGIGAAVKQGAPVPDISTVDGLRRALLAAHSIAYSDSASGVYIQNEMFKKLGIEDQVRGKAHMIPATPVGEIVAKGEADLGFQQISELRPVAGHHHRRPLAARGAGLDALLRRRPGHQPRQAASPGLPRLPRLHPGRADHQPNRPRTDPPLLNPSTLAKALSRWRERVG